jgi:hypothetical protein
MISRETMGLQYQRRWGTMPLADTKLEDFSLDEKPLSAYPIGEAAGLGWDTTWRKTYAAFAVA